MCRAHPLFFITHMLLALAAHKGRQGSAEGKQKKEEALACIPVKT